MDPIHVFARPPKLEVALEVLPTYNFLRLFEVVHPVVNHSGDALSKLLAAYIH